MAVNPPLAADRYRLLIVFFIFKARLTQMNMHIDQTCGDQLAFGIDHFVSPAVSGNEEPSATVRLCHFHAYVFGLKFASFAG